MASLVLSAYSPQHCRSAQESEHRDANDPKDRREVIEVVERRYSQRENHNSLVCRIP